MLILNIVISSYRIMLCLVSTKSCDYNFPVYIRRRSSADKVIKAQVHENVQLVFIVIMLHG